MGVFRDVVDLGGGHPGEGETDVKTNLGILIDRLGHLTAGIFIPHLVRHLTVQVLTTSQKEISVIDLRLLVLSLQLREDRRTLGGTQKVN